MDASGPLSINSGSWLYPWSNPTNGGMTSGTGWGTGAGAPTQGPRGGGAGHGGNGGTGTEGTNGFAYGSSNAPALPGSGGGGGYGLRAGRGGGVVRLDVFGTATIDGTLSANANNAGDYGGGGSGGSIWLTCQRLAGGASGVVRANGGNGASAEVPIRGGGGGGGRIAFQYATHTEAWTPTVYGGTGNVNGASGTIVRLLAEPRGTLFFVR